MKRRWNSIDVMHDDSRQFRHTIMSTTMGGYAKFELYLLNNNNVVAYGMVHDGMAAYEYDDIDEAFAQYDEWVRDQREREISFTKHYYLRDKR